MTLTCLRCHAVMEEYLFTDLSFMSYGAGHAHVMVECQKCGHVEFLSGTSPLLAELKASPMYAGDGD